MLIDQQLANTSICFSHFSDKFISHFSIPKSKFWRVMGRNGHKPTSFLLLFIYIEKKVCVYFFFSIFFPSTNLNFGDLGKKWGSTYSFHIHFFIPQIQISARFGKNGLGPNWLNIHLCLGIAYANEI